ncbi:MAG: hypothetical protein GWN79_10510, partial [Actinobacteria bacterium]|nr:hypothetical protein [Actinomycetota bacterium]NIS31658.1 hypothetical protein [Actinomycetota bacterium]NIU19486.1 hypothetical protein [Actinomycetota bacterium]NIU66768.1 hypothetical protein [Actinomycetota bacterium]NIW28574.1 hypothetical protein [Actinomycetota bacterium]
MTLRYETDPGIGAAIITLDRPDVRNALNLELYEAVLAAAERAAADDTVRSVILTGAGDRAFSAGADMDELAARNHLTETGPASARRRAVTALLESM